MAISKSHRQRTTNPLVEVSGCAESSQREIRLRMEALSRAWFSEAAQSFLRTDSPRTHGYCTGRMGHTRSFRCSLAQLSSCRTAFFPHTCDGSNSPRELYHASQAFDDEARSVGRDRSWVLPGCRYICQLIQHQSLPAFPAGVSCIE